MEYIAMTTRIWDDIESNSQIGENIYMDEVFSACLEMAIESQTLDIWLEFFEEINEATGEAYMDVHQLISTEKGEATCLETTDVPMSEFNQREMQNNYIRARNLLMMCLKPLGIHQFSHESSYYEDTYCMKKLFKAISQNEAIDNIFDLMANFFYYLDKAMETKIFDITLDYFYDDINNDHPNLKPLIKVEQLISTGEIEREVLDDYTIHPDDFDEHKAAFVAAREVLMEILKPYGIHGLEG
jgi:hypothetical protein